MATMIPGDIEEFGTEGEKAFYKFLEGVAKLIGFLGLLGLGLIESLTSQKTKVRRNGDREKPSGGMMKRYKKKIAHRYDASALVEAQFEPGSRRRVLKNLLGINRKREMDRVEGLEQLRALRELIKIYGKSHRFTAAVYAGFTEYG